MEITDRREKKRSLQWKKPLSRECTEGPGTFCRAGALLSRLRQDVSGRKGKKAEKKRLFFKRKEQGNRTNIRRIRENEEEKRRKMVIFLKNEKMIDRTCSPVVKYASMFGKVIFA